MMDSLQITLGKAFRFLKPVTKDDLDRLKQEEYDAEAEEANVRGEALREFRACSDLKLLADRLGVAKIITSSSTREKGQYLQQDSASWPIGGWELSERRTAHINGITGNAKKAVILIDVLMSHLEESVSGVLAHEIGHHIDYLAHGKFNDSAPKRRFQSAFERTGFHANPVSHSEFIAETLGKFLCGHVLSPALLTEVKKTLDKLPRDQANIINEFHDRRMKNGSL
jgi:hypothetical protein